MSVPTICLEMPYQMTFQEQCDAVDGPPNPCCRYNCRLWGRYCKDIEVQLQAQRVTSRLEIATILYKKLPTDVCDRIAQFTVHSDSALRDSIDAINKYHAHYDRARVLHNLRCLFAGKRLLRDEDSEEFHNATPHLV